MAANQSIVFEDSRGAKEKVLLENLDKRRNCQKDEGQLNHFLPLTSEFMTPSIQGFHWVFGDAAGLMQKSWWKSFLVSIFKKSCRVQSTQRKKKAFKSKQKRPKVKEKLLLEKGGVEKERVTKKFKLFCPSFIYFSNTKGKRC